MSSAMDLEARIAELDERLRLARSDTVPSSTASTVRTSRPQSHEPAGFPTTEPTENLPQQQHQQQQQAAPLNDRRDGSLRTPQSPYYANAYAASLRSPEAQDPYNLTSYRSPPKQDPSLPLPRYQQSNNPMPFLNVRLPTADPVVTHYQQQQSRSLATGTNNMRTSPQSPWKTVSDVTLKADTHEFQQLVERQRFQSNTMESRLVDAEKRLHGAQSQVSHMDSTLSRQSRQQDIAAAETMRSLEEADRRLGDVERREAQSTVAIAEMHNQQTTLTRQVDEARLAIRRAEVRSTELTRELQSLDAKVAECESTVTEQQRRIEDDNLHSQQIRRRLETRLVELHDETKANQERLKRLEATHVTQEKAWRDAEESLDSTITATESMLQETKMRVQSLELELADREREAESQRRLREQRTEQTLAERARERAADTERHRMEVSHFKDRSSGEKEENLAVLRGQLEEQHAQLEKKQRDRDRQRATVEDLKHQLQQLTVSLEEKRLTAQECGNLEAELRSLEHQYQSTRDEVTALQASNVSKEDEVQILRGAARKLQQRLDDERRLKQTLADSARELTECETTRAQQLEALEKDEQVGIERLNEAKQTLLQVKDETERVVQNSTVELDALSRRIPQVRHNVLDRESKLNRAISENALKQATIVGLEEEKRKLEREQLARKASAAQAARAALVELDA